VTSSLDAFLRAPRGRFDGAHFSFWSLGRVSGWKVWGHPTVLDGEQLVACIETLLRPRAPRYWSLVDLRALEVVGELGFEVLRAWVERHRAPLARRLVRQAVLKPRGVVGAMVAGFYVQLTPGHPVRVFESEKEACAWLAPEAPGELRALRAELQRDASEASLVPTLRRWLAEHAEVSRAPQAAKALGVSVRTLHRKLAAEATAFHQELRRARVERAQALLRDTEWKLAHVAQECGFSSGQRLATAFREVLGMTPTAFRAEARAGVTR
jgi:AraC-like DNA-binding protein